MLTYRFGRSARRPLNSTPSIFLQANDYNKLKEKTTKLVSTNQRLTTEAEKQQQTVAQQTEYIQSFESVDKKSNDNVRCTAVPRPPILAALS